jgi:hypothetical protein
MLSKEWGAYYVKGRLLLAFGTVVGLDPDEYRVTLEAVDIDDCNVAEGAAFLLAACLRALAGKGQTQADKRLYTSLADKAQSICNTLHDRGKREASARNPRPPGWGHD